MNLAQIPHKSLNKLRDAREAVYRKSREEILDLIPQYLVTDCISPLRNIQRIANLKFHILCNDIQRSAGNGDQILTPLSNEIIRFQIDKVDVA